MTVSLLLRRYDKKAVQQQYNDNDTVVKELQNKSIGVIYN